MKIVEVGKKYNKLTVISLSDGQFADKRPRYNCICDCGKPTVVRKTHIGVTNSCGCSQIGKPRRPVENPKGNRYGRLVVVSRDSSGLRKCLCTCDCGNSLSVELRLLKSGTTTSCGCYQKEASSKAVKIYYQNLRSSKGLDPFVNIRKRVTGGVLSKLTFERDSYSCLLCNSSNELNAHHIVPWNVDESLREELSNMVTLCRKCHVLAHDGNFRKINPILAIIFKGYISIIEDKTKTILES